MRRKLEISPQAHADLDEIWFYVVADNPRAADQLINKIRQKIKSLVIFPESGTSRPDFGSGVRSVPAGNYLVIFRVLPSLVEVVHGARDVKAEL